MSDGPHMVNFFFFIGKPNYIANVLSKIEMSQDEYVTNKKGDYIKKIGWKEGV